MTETVDYLLKKFGDPGRYQLLVLALLWTAMSSLSLNNYVALFTVMYFPHRCKLPSDWSWPINESIPIKHSGQYESCLMYIDPSNHTLGTTTCLYGWEHQTTFSSEWTIVQEWDLVCDHYYLSALATSAYFVGNLLGSILFGYLSDRIGRKPVILVSMYVQIVIGITLSFSINYIMYVILRFVHGFILQGTFAASYPLSVELFLPHRRSAVAIINETSWAIMMLVLTVLAYWLGNWRHIHLAITLPALISITYYWLLPESPRWLLSTCRMKRARNELIRFARRNNIPVPSDLEREIDQLKGNAKNTEHQQRTYGVKDLFRKRRLRIILAITCYTLFTAVINFYGIAFSVPDLGGDPHVNFAIGGVIELVVTCGMYFILVRFGRRQILITSMVACAFFLSLTIIFQITSESTGVEWLHLPTVIVAFISRATMIVCFCCLLMFTNELYPTVVRTLGNSFCFVSGRIGGMIVPQILLLDRYVWKSLPFLIFTLLALFAAFLIVFLPETRNKPLPEIPDDIDSLWENKETKRKKRIKNNIDNIALDCIDHTNSTT